MILAVRAPHARFNRERFSGWQICVPLFNEASKIVRVDGGLPTRTPQLWQ